MTGITKENIHYWNPQNPFFSDMMLADIPNHGLKYFDNNDDLINWLFFNGFKDSAREINKGVAA